jgi:hypothetical protein
MSTSSRDRQKKSYTLMRMIYDLTMSVLFLGMSLLMLFPKWFKLLQFEDIDQSFRYMFGGICLLYGGFRLYRGLKKNY